MQVATLRDPASARLGESLYTFLPRSVVGNLRDGVVMELDRLRARQLPFFCLQNRQAAILRAGTCWHVPPYMQSVAHAFLLGQLQAVCWMWESRVALHQI